MPPVISLHDTEHILVADAFTGNRQAFGKLYNKYAPLLLGCLLKIIPDKKMAEDVLQRSFIEIWKNRHRYDSGSLFVWMHGITKKTALLYIDKKQKTTGVKSQKPSGIVYADSNLDKKDFLCYPETISENESDEVHKIILELMYFNGHSLKEVSGILNIDEGKLKIMLRCVVNKLKTLAR